MEKGKRESRKAESLYGVFTESIGVQNRPISFALSRLVCITVKTKTQKTFQIISRSYRWDKKMHFVGLHLQNLILRIKLFIYLRTLKGKAPIKTPAFDEMRRVNNRLNTLNRSR